jgi:hypothetical protein
MGVRGLVAPIAESRPGFSEQSSCRHAAPWNYENACMLIARASVFDHSHTETNAGT